MQRYISGFWARCTQMDILVYCCVHSCRDKLGFLCLVNGFRLLLAQCTRDGETFCKISNPFLQLGPLPSLQLVIQTNQHLAAARNALCGLYYSLRILLLSWFDRFYGPEWSLVPVLSMDRITSIAIRMPPAADYHTILTIALPCFIWKFSDELNLVRLSLYETCICLRNESHRHGVQ